MSKRTIRTLQAADAGTVRTILAATWRQRVHEVDRATIAPEELRRRLTHQYRSDVVANGANQGLFIDGKLCSLALHGDGVHPLTRATERHILDFADVSGSAELLRKLLASAVKKARVDGIEILRIEISTHSTGDETLLGIATALGFCQHHLVLRRVVVPSPMPEGRFEFTSQPFRAFAIACIVQGLINSLSKEATVTPQQIIQYAKRRFARLQTERRLSVVALGEDDQPRAHALAELVPSALRPQLEGRLFDIFVPSDWKGQGWSVRLWRYVEQLLHARGIDRAEGTLLLDRTPVPETLILGLQREGWWIDRRSLMLRLRD